MQEFESAKLLKETLEAAGFKVELGGAGMPTNVWAEYGCGRPKIVIVTEVDALPGGSQTPGHLRAQAAGEGRPRPHGGPQHPRRRGVARGLRGEAGDAAPQHSRHGRDLVRAGRGAAEQPAVPGARRLFQGRRRDPLSAHRRRARRPASACRTTPRSARSSPSTARPRTARSIPGTARTRSMPSS